MKVCEFKGKKNQGLLKIGINIHGSLKVKLYMKLHILCKNRIEIEVLLLISLLNVSK